MSKLIESMKQEFSLFLHALQYYSRIPVGQIDFCEEKLTPALRYFPLVGIIVGGLAAVVFALFALALHLPQSVAAVAALAAMILATGALHEDGFADFFDGFGGGYTKERILEIMKDSRSGAYGVMALILAFLLKFSLFVSISSSQLPWVLVAAHSTSRFTPILMIRNSQYARVENSKAGHTRRKPDTATIVIAAVLAAVPLVFLNWKIMLAILPIFALIYIVLKRYIEKRIGGFTGDVLGAMQQFNEIAFYLAYAAIAVWV
ncbi:MAG TPA: adenosylcobinamide-GDP ribazoletransferase [Myxococcota bacterium]|nr:adenosylcobinamide-GDP ribazoletransferase [Myxococcota bacterium]HON25276.1 adenosylcobinamide-GDP ribazoletransferase [Myxococcota bacterium]HOS62458.1 adenosylcobinamide-GDP ribazoletransferase [Myxococcota bacterium]HPC90841.1 adenosylcobinamide-GDP ribazoletransferase [Myxococcota bacterium]HPL25574.1 adenosylcobinamide-GDP ribazoletransferase [Myxococcota bacterium]